MFVRRYDSERSRGTGRRHDSADHLPADCLPYAGLFQVCSGDAVNQVRSRCNSAVHHVSLSLSHEHQRHHQHHVFPLPRISSTSFSLDFLTLSLIALPSQLTLMSQILLFQASDLPCSARQSIGLLGEYGRSTPCRSS